MQTQSANKELHLPLLAACTQCRAFLSTRHREGLCYLDELAVQLCAHNTVHRALLLPALPLLWLAGSSLAGLLPRQVAAAIQ